MIIIASSGAGKTHWIKQCGGTYHGYRLQDGDAVVTYPTQHRWWEDEALNEETQEATTSEMAKYIDTHPDTIVLWYADIERLLKKLSYIDGDLSVIAVTPRDGQLAHNAGARRADQVARGWKNVQPTELTELIKHRNHVVTVAGKYRIPAVRDFNLAGAIAVAWLRWQEELRAK